VVRLVRRRHLDGRLARERGEAGVPRRRLNISASTPSRRAIQRLGPGERHSPADHPGLRFQRPSPGAGAPLRLYSPVKLGYKLTKYLDLAKITFTAERHGGYWEDKGYPWLGGV
jgi:hypothetical protein